MHISLSRRDMDLHVATSFLTPLCHVATWIYTSRRQLVQLSVTSRRGPARRDVVWSCALSHRDVNPNVATWACFLSVTSRRHPARRDVLLFLAQERFIFGTSSHTPSLIGTLALLHTIAHRSRRSPHPTRRRPSIAHRPSEFIFEPPSALVPSHCGNPSLF